MLSLALLAATAHAAGPAKTFGDVRDRLGCQLPGHTQYPFCESRTATPPHPMATPAAPAAQRVPGVWAPSG